MQPSRLTNLAAAMRLTSNGSASTCFHRAAALMLDLPGAVMVFGVLAAASEAEGAMEPRASAVPFIHAWVEYQGQVLAPTLIDRMGGKLCAIARHTYYRVNGIECTWRLPHAAFVRVARRYRLAAALKHGSDRAGSGDMVDALLRSAGVRYVLSDQRAVLPK